MTTKFDDDWIILRKEFLEKEKLFLDDNRL